MKCSRVRDKLMGYTSADLPPGELHRINEHLMGCDECRAALEVARRASSALEMLGSEESAPSLITAVREKIARDTRRARPVLLPRLAIGFSTAAVVVLVVTGLLHHGSAQHTNVAVKPAANQPRVAAPVRPAPEVKTAAKPPIVAQDTEKAAPTVAPERQPVRTLAAHVRHLKRAADLESAPIVPEPEVAEPEADSEPVIMIAVQPKEPEIYMMRLDSEEQEPATDLTVVREFDEGGNITSVSIRGEASPNDSTDTAVPAMDRTQLIDVPPAGDVRAEIPHAGGSAANA